MSFHNPFRRPRPKSITKKQSARLGRLLEVRRGWWKDSQESGQPLICGICFKPIRRFEDLASDHIEPGKMGGCRRDAEDNLQPAHSWCNQEKGSNRKPLEKFVPRKAGRVMRVIEAEQYWKGKICLCSTPEKSNPKKEFESVCPDCLLKLSDQAKRDLERTTGIEYRMALAAAEIEILKWKADE